MNHEEILEILERENYKEVIKAIIKFDTRIIDWEKVDVIANEFLDGKYKCSFLDEDLYELAYKLHTLK